MFNKIKDLKNLKDQANQIKQTLSQETVQAEAQHGKVTVVMDGNMEILSLDIDAELLSPDKKEDLEKAVKEAVSSAIKKAQRAMAMKIQGMGGLPGM